MRFKFTADTAMSREEALRQALNDLTGDPVVDAYSRRTLLASIDPGDLALRNVWFQEAGPEQAEMDLHLTGEGVRGHATRAWEFGHFVSGVAQAVKETAKSLAGQASRSKVLEVEGAAPGSVRVVLRVPPVDNNAQSGIEETENVDSRALRRIGTLFSVASTHEDEGTIDGDLSGFPSSARQALSSAVNHLRRTGVVLEGQVYQRRVGLDHVCLSLDGAERLSKALARRLEDEDEQRVTGRIDGQQRSRGVMWLIPDGGGAPLKASVPDPDLMDEVAALGGNEDQRVTCTFHVVRSYAEGSTSGGRVSRRLDRIKPVLETGPLF